MLYNSITFNPIVYKPNEIFSEFESVYGLLEMQAFDNAQSSTNEQKIAGDYE